MSDKKIVSELRKLNRREAEILFAGAYLSPDDYVELNKIRERQKELKTKLLDEKEGVENG